MHDAAREFIAAQAANHRPFEAVLEIGSRDVNGSIREYFAPASYLGIDLVAGDGVDLVADATSEWEPPGDFDAIVCCEVFEHERQWRQIIANAHRWLRPRGLLLITCAGPGRAPHSGLDGGALRAREHYENIDPKELAIAIGAAGFTRMEFDLDTPGDIHATAWKAA